MNRSFNGVYLSRLLALPLAQRNLKVMVVQDSFIISVFLRLRRYCIRKVKAPEWQCGFPRLNSRFEGCLLELFWIVDLSAALIIS